jgi:MoaA/NifB/PqqE/SkfB family radical SAM enzyme
MASITSITGRLIDTGLGEKAVQGGTRLLYNDAIRRPLLDASWWMTNLFLRVGRRHGASDRIDRELQLFARSIVEAVDRIAGRRAISKDFMAHATLLWLRALAGAEQDEARRRFRDVYGVEPPWVLVVAPTGACNLGCPGCYSGASTGGGSMPFYALDRLIDEAKKLWGIKVVVFTGGEPFLYRSESKGILDVIERHPDLLSLIFTNGTLIDRAAAKRLATLGTPTVALSVEGLRQSTDARRGPGAFDRIMRSLDELHDAGALPGISMTATRNNCEEIFSDELIDFFFDEKSVFYGFVFQYMPEGREPDPALMPTPEQRLWMWKRSWEVIEERKIPLFDFWNHGTMIGGCVAAGRERGYLYVDWDGNVMPCVFAPYSTCNIHEIHSRGGTLNDAWETPLLAGIREWQTRHATCGGAVVSDGAGGGMVCACPVRDHYADFMEIIEHSGAKPVDSSADSCSTNPAFVRQMIDYGRDFATYSRPVLDAEYGQQPPAIWREEDSGRSPGTPA